MSLNRRLRGWVLCAQALGSLACAVEDPQGGSPLGSLDRASLLVCSDKKFQEEPELFGVLYQNGQPLCQQVRISLEPDDSTKQRLYMTPQDGYEPVLMSDPLFAIQFGWWDPIEATDLNGTTGCSPAGSVAQFHFVGSSAMESHGHDGVNGPPWDPNNGDGGTGSGKEGHCVRPGGYTLLVEDPEAVQFKLDYIQTTPGAVIHNTSVTPERWEYVELPVYDPTVSAHDLRVLVDFPLDGGRGTESGTQLLVQNAHGNPTDSFLGFVNEPAPTGSPSDWFRFSVATTALEWDGPDSLGSRSALARLFWDTSGSSQVSGYYDLNGTQGYVMRVHRFPNPADSSRVYTVGLEIKRPDEAPAAAPTTTRQVTITRLPTDLQPQILSVGANASTLSLLLRKQNSVVTPQASEPPGWRGTVELKVGATVVRTWHFTESTTIPAKGSREDLYQFPLTGVGAGSYTVQVSLDTDPQTARSETIETNNSTSATVQLGLADLRPTAFSASPSVLAGGDLLTTNVTVKNEGGAAAGGSGYDIWLSTDTVLSPSTDILVKPYVLGALAPGQSVSYSRSVDLASGIQPGEYFVLVWVDPLGRVAESNENNNVRATASTITVTSPVLSAPSGFTVASCYQTTVAGKQYANYVVTWSAANQPVNTVYEIGEATVNSSTQAVTIRSQTATIHTDTLTNYRIFSTAPPRYEWIRHRNGADTTGWVALNQNPLLPSEGCVF
jgi:hypothetical protein